MGEGVGQAKEALVQSRSGYRGFRETKEERYVSRNRNLSVNGDQRAQHVDGGQDGGPCLGRA